MSTHDRKYILIFDVMDVYTFDIIKNVRIFYYYKCNFNVQTIVFEGL